jgi:hypothetical protein
LAFFHLALAAAEIRARPSALILRLLLVGVVWVPFILAHLARAAAAIFALPAADIRRRFLPATAGIVVSPKMDASCVSSCSICSLTRLGGFDSPENFFYCASGWYDAGTLIA